MNLQESFFNFVTANKNADCNELLLRFHRKELEFPIEFAVTQIIARKKTSSKLSGFIASEKFVFPDLVSAEQSSDQRVASYHLSLIGSGKDVLDMTCGLGIDAMTIAKGGNNVVACEINSVKHEALEHNAIVCGATSLTALNRDCVEFISGSKDTYDVIFIDPARRDNNNRRTYSFRHCMPDASLLMPEMLEHADRVYIKASPLLDISSVCKEIPETTKIHIVCVKGECKEVLVEIIKGRCFDEVRVVDLDDHGYVSNIGFKTNELSKNAATMASKSDFVPGNYLYEPNSGVMKLDSYGVVAERFPELKRTGVNTSLYISSELIGGFPGRITRMSCIADKNILKRLKGERCNVVARNYPLTAADLRKKLNLREGKDSFLYAFRALEENVPLICLTKQLINIENEY